MKSARRRRKSAADCFRSARSMVDVLTKVVVVAASVSAAVARTQADESAEK